MFYLDIILIRFNFNFVNYLRRKCKAYHNPMKTRGKVVKGLFLTLLLAAVMIAPVQAATDTVVVAVEAPLASSASLTLGVSAIVFPDSDPDTTPSISATQNPVSVTANAQTNPGSTVNLNVRAPNLSSGTNTIAITNVTWTATGSGFRSGTMGTTNRLAGRWVGSGTRIGTFSYFFANNWTYRTGNYTSTATYTLTAP